MANGEEWRARAATVYAWFHGRNAVGVSLVDADRGLCHDGLHPDRMNENAGAESILAYLGARLAIETTGMMENDEHGGR